jgi:hypothetical protein
MYLACILITSEDTCIPHVSCMDPSCIPHLRYVPFKIHLRYMYLFMYLRCIPHVSWSPLQIHVSRMYPACIPHVSYISDTYLSRYIWDTCISICILDVSRMYPSCILVYPDVSWWRIKDTCILMYPYMYPVWHQGSAQDTCILMYPMCIPKCILDSFGIRVKYMHNVKDTCILLDCNRTCRIHLRYIRIHSGYMYPAGYMQDTCRIHAGYIRIRIV